MLSLSKKTQHSVWELRASKKVGNTKISNVTACSHEGFFFFFFFGHHILSELYSMSRIIKFEGHQYFRQRLILSALSGRIIRIDKIRSNDENPGLRGMESVSNVPRIASMINLLTQWHHFQNTDYEASFLRLLEKLTNGSTVEISYTGMEQSRIIYLPPISTSKSNIWLTFGS
jgi:hypothetical protein